MMYLSTTQAASLLKIREYDLVSWVQGKTLIENGVAILTVAPKVKKSSGSKRQFNYLDLIRCQKELAYERLIR